MSASGGPAPDSRAAGSLRSMTGYGRGQSSSVDYRVDVTLRSVNHRYLDLSIRLREPFREHEASLREILSSVLHRGRVEVGVEISALGKSEVEVFLREEVLEALAGPIARAAERSHVAETLALGDLLRLPEVLCVETRPRAFREEDRAALVTATLQALQALQAARELEGRQLADVLAGHLAGLSGFVERATKLRDEVRAGLREQLGRRLQDLMQTVELDPGRLEQEAAILLDRTDVQEELDRLSGHLDHFRAAMAAAARDSEAVGKRLDFLSQEILRELNTLGSKSRDTAMAHGVVDAKVICEQLREQVQNVE